MSQYDSNADRELIEARERQDMLFPLSAARSNAGFPWVDTKGPQGRLYLFKVDHGGIYAIANHPDCPVALRNRIHDEFGCGECWTTRADGVDLHAFTLTEVEQLYRLWATL